MLLNSLIHHSDDRPQLRAVCMKSQVSCLCWTTEFKSTPLLSHTSLPNIVIWQSFSHFSRKNGLDTNLGFLTANECTLHYFKLKQLRTIWPSKIFNRWIYKHRYCVLAWTKSVRCDFREIKVVFLSHLKWWRLDLTDIKPPTKFSRRFLVYTHLSRRAIHF